MDVIDYARITASFKNPYALSGNIIDTRFGGESGVNMEQLTFTISSGAMVFTSNCSTTFAFWDRPVQRGVVADAFNRIQFS